MSADGVERIVAAHGERMRRLDPLLPQALPLPEREAGATPMVVPGGVGQARVIATSLDSIAAIWTAAQTYHLFARVGGDDPTAAMNALLTQWREDVVATATDGDRDSAAAIRWPSRDTAMTASFLDCGLAPLTVLAIRQPRPAALVTTGDVVVRPLREADLDDAVALHLEVIRWDAQFGGMTERSATRGLLRAGFVDALARDEPWVWVADAGGGPVGLIAVTPPERTESLTALTSARSIAYVSCMIVSAAARASGIGSALVDTAHAAMDRAGAEVSLLYYSGLNPLSGPFWHRSGYRPLWTSWELRPAALLRKP